jgi:hypothetical protein
MFALPVRIRPALFGTKPQGGKKKLTYDEQHALVEADHRITVKPDDDGPKDYDRDLIARLVATVRRLSGESSPSTYVFGCNPSGLDHREWMIVFLGHKKDGGIVRAVKVYRQITGQGLKSSVDLVRKGPGTVLHENLDMEEALRFDSMYQAANVLVEMRPQ